MHQLRKEREKGKSAHLKSRWVLHEASGRAEAASRGSKRKSPKAHHIHDGAKLDGEEQKSTSRLPAKCLRCFQAVRRVHSKGKMYRNMRAWNERNPEDGQIRLGSQLM